MKCQGSLQHADGAAIPASSKFQEDLRQTGHFSVVTLQSQTTDNLLGHPIYQFVINCQLNERAGAAARKGDAR